MGTAPALQLVNLSFRYAKGAFELHDLSLTLEQGGYLTILGSSGCGKSTVMKLIAGFLLPNSGQIRVCGNDVTMLSPGQRGIVSVFQESSLFPHLRVWENVAFGLMARSGGRVITARSKAEQMLARVGMPKEFSERRPEELSGGQKQRAALARALVMEPKIILLDEPLAAIDDPLRGEIEDLLHELKRKSETTFVEVTHIQEHAMAISTRMALLEEGKILEEGIPSEIYSRPRTAFAASFLGGANILAGDLRPSDEGEAWFIADGGFTSLCKGRLLGEFKPDRRAWFVLRPESISFKSRPSTDNSCGADVSDKAFRGGHTEYRLLVKESQIKVRSLGQEASIRVGDTVELHWFSGDSVLISAPEKEGK